MNIDMDQFLGALYSVKVCMEQKRHINILHIKLCPVISVTGLLVGYLDKKIYVPWVPKIAHKSLTP